MMKTIYKDDEDVISFEQALLMSDYQIHYITDSGDIKRIDEIFKNELVTIKYFIDSSENEKLIVKDLSSIVSNVNICERNLFGNMLSINEKRFRDTELKFITNTLYDENNDELCREYLDLITGVPISEETTKYYNDDDELFTAEYDAKGNFIFMEHYFKSYWEQKNRRFITPAISKSYSRIFSTEQITMLHLN